MRPRSLSVILVLVATISLPAAPVGGAEGFPPCRRAAELPPGTPVNVELAGVGPTSVTVTWLTCNVGAPAETQGSVEVARAEAPQGRAVRDTKTAFHHVRVDGLEPGTTYRYVVTSGLAPAAPERSNPALFTTLPRPPGRELFTLAVLADVHVGEEVSGLATSTPDELPPGYRARKPYPAVMLEAAVEDVKGTGASLTLLPADNSAHGELHQLEDARAILRHLEMPYVVARGAHDRPNQYEAAESECPPDGDCFRRVFGPRRGATSGPLPRAVVHRGWMVIALDSADPATGTGRIGQDQIDWMRIQLERAGRAGWPAIVFFHHPVAEYSSTLAVPPAVFGVEQRDAQRFLQTIAEFDVRLVINSHTHRNWIAYSPRTGRMPIIEVGPTKEYPAGFTTLTIFEGGLIRQWVPIDCGFCNMWRETTRGEYLSLYPLYTLGSLRDRNFVHLFEGPDVPGIPSLPLGIWPPVVPGSA